MAPSELAEIFRREVDDVAAPFLWSDEDISLYLDQAQREFARQTDCFLDSTTASVCRVPIAANQALVALSQLVTKIRRAELAATFRPVRVTTLAEMDEGQITGRDYGLSVPTQWRTATGEPRFAVEDYEPGKLLLAPIPTAADTLNLTVYRLPLNKIAIDSAAFEVKDEDHQYHLLSYMQFLAYSRQDADTYSPKRAQAAKEQWLESVSAARLAFRRKRFVPKAIAYGGI